jgi:hypothetical protein
LTNERESIIFDKSEKKDRELIYSDWDGRPAVSVSPAEAYAILERYGEWIKVDGQDVFHSSKIIPTREAFQKTFFGSFSTFFIPHEYDDFIAYYRDLELYKAIKAKATVTALLEPDIACLNEIRARYFLDNNIKTHGETFEKKPPSAANSWPAYWDDEPDVRVDLPIADEWFEHRGVPQNSSIQNETLTNKLINKSRSFGEATYDQAEKIRLEIECKEGNFQRLVNQNGLDNDIAWLVFWCGAGLTLWSFFNLGQYFLIFGQLGSVITGVWFLFGFMFIGFWWSSVLRARELKALKDELARLDDSLSDTGYSH